MGKFFLKYYIFHIYIYLAFCIHPGLLHSSASLHTCVMQAWSSANKHINWKLRFVRSLYKRCKSSRVFPHTMSIAVCELDDRAIKLRSYDIIASLTSSIDWQVVGHTMHKIGFVSIVGLQEAHVSATAPSNPASKDKCHYDYSHLCTTKIASFEALLIMLLVQGHLEHLKYAKAK